MEETEEMEEVVIGRCSCPELASKVSSLRIDGFAA
jgi:hypothetical protein